MNIVVTGVPTSPHLRTTYTVDRWGCRVLMITGSAALAVIYAILGTAYYFEVRAWPCCSSCWPSWLYAMSLAPIVCRA